MTPEIAIAAVTVFAATTLAAHLLLARAVAADAARRNRTDGPLRARITLLTGVFGFVAYRRRVRAESARGSGTG